MSKPKLEVGSLATLLPTLSNPTPSPHGATVERIVGNTIYADFGSGVRGYHRYEIHPALKVVANGNALVLPVLYLTAGGTYAVVSNKRGVVGTSFDPAKRNAYLVVHVTSGGIIPRPPTLEKQTRYTAGVIARADESYSTRAGIIGDAEMSRFHRYAMEKLKRRP